MERLHGGFTLELSEGAFPLTTDSLALAHFVRLPKNARVLEAAGGAVVMLERDCTPEKLYAQIRALLADDKRREQMAKKLHGLARLDSTECICAIVEELSRK